MQKETQQDLAVSLTIMQPHQSNQSMHSQQHIQQMQQMHQHLQAQMQHQSAAIGAPHSGASMSPAGLGTNTGQSMISSNRPLSSMHQNFPQLMQHQMYSQAMANPQVQQSQNMLQQAQAQMGSHQPDHSKAQQQQQQQQQAALYWNAVAAKKNKPGMMPRSQSLTSSSLSADSQLMQQQQQQRANQQIPNIPSSRLVTPRITPINQPSVGSTVGPAQDVSTMSNAGVIDNKNMSHEQMLLLRQQQIIAELQSQLQQVTANGANSSRFGMSNLNLNTSSSFNDLNAQQVNANMNSQANNQLQQIGHNGTFPYGGINPGNQKMERKNSMLQQHQHQLGISSNMHGMITGSAQSLISDTNKISDFGQDPLQLSGGSKQQQQQFMNSLGGTAMNQAPNALMQNQLFQNNMKQPQRRTSHDSILGLQGIQSQQQRRGNFNFFNNRKSIQPTSQMQRNSSGGAKNTSLDSDRLTSSALQEDDLLLQLQMSQNILNSNSDDNNNKGDDLDDNSSQVSSSKNSLDRKSSKRKNSATNGNKTDQNLKKRNADVSSKSLKNHGRGKNSKRKLNSDVDEVDSCGVHAMKLSLSEDKNVMTGGWQSHDDIPDRRRMIVCVVKVIEQMRPDASKISHK